MVHVGTRISIEALESRGKAIGNVSLPIAWSPATSLKSCAWTVSMNRNALLIIPQITLSFSRYPRVSSSWYINGLWEIRWGTHVHIIAMAPISKDARPKPFKMFRRIQDFVCPPSSLCRIVKRINATLEKSAFELNRRDIPQHNGTSIHRRSIAACNEMCPDGKGRYSLLIASSWTSRLWFETLNCSKWVHIHKTAQSTPPTPVPGEATTENVI